MPNDIKVLTFITNEMLRQVKNNLQFVKNIGGQEYADLFTKSPKKGDTISIRKPTRYMGRTGEVFSAEDYKERVVTMSVGTTLGVDLTFTNRELMLNLDQISERIVKPAAESLASQIDTYYLNLAIQATPAQVGTPGTIPNGATALKTYNQARAKMSWQGAPNAGATLLISPDMQVEAVDAGKLIFNPTGEIASQYETGMIGRHSGAKVYEVQNLPVHVNGQRGGTPITSGVTADGATSILVSGFTAGVANRVLKGDTFTLALTYGTNPWTRQTYGALRQFTAAADAASDGAGVATILLTTPITASGNFQNVTNVPAPGAALVFEGAGSLAYPVGLRFHRDAFLFGTLSQPNPDGAVEFSKTVSDPSTGLTIRYIRDWDTRNNLQLDRFDVVPAWGVAFPEFACRIAS